jgi:hypothetical protein
MGLLGEFSVVKIGALIITNTSYKAQNKNKTGVLTFRLDTPVLFLYYPSIFIVSIKSFNVRSASS